MALTETTRGAALEKIEKAKKMLLEQDTYTCFEQMSTPRRFGWSGCGECLRPAWELSIVYNHENQLQNKQTDCLCVLILIRF
jgi:hypothetical protein